MLGIINDYNLSAEDINKLPIRKKARGVIFLDKKTIICVEERNNKMEILLGLPGGTIEDNENEIVAFSREVEEETGYEIEDVVFIGVVKVIRKEYVSHTSCYKAKTKGIKKDINFTSEEIEVETRPLEIDLETAFNRINEEYNKNPNDNSLRSLLILKEIRKII